METMILEEYDWLGQHYIDTNKGTFVLEYSKKTVCIRNEEGKVISIVDWDSSEYLSEEIIKESIK